MDIESRILYENGVFYAYQLPNGGIEIRKNESFTAKLLGTVSELEQAIRFIDRAVLYPRNF